MLDVFARLIMSSGMRTVRLHLTKSSIAINDRAFDLNLVSDILVVDSRLGHWSFTYNDSTCVHVKMIDNAQESTASWVVAVGSTVASSILSRKTRGEQDGGDESTSSHPDFEKLSRYFDIGTIRKVNIREFDFLSSAVFIDDRLAKRGSLCLIDNVLVLAPSYISGHFDDVRDVTPLCTSSKMLMKSTPRRKSLLNLFPVLNAREK